MNRIKDNIGIVQRYVDDVKVGVEFQQIIDSDGHEILAKVYTNQGAFVADVNATGEQSFAALKGAHNIVLCDFSQIPSSNEYVIVFSTAESGVLAKGALTLFNSDGFTVGTLGEDVFTVTTLNNLIDDGANVINKPGVTGYLQWENIRLDGNTISNPVDDLNFSSLTNIINVTNAVIKSAGDPVDAQDLATKNYVDTTIAGSGFLTEPDLETLMVNVSPNIASTYNLGSSTRRWLRLFSDGIDSLSADIDNVNIDGNTISTTDIDGNIILSPNGNGVTQFNSSITFDSDSVYSIGTNSVRPLNIYTDNLTSSDIFTGSVNIGAETITDALITQWNEAYLWGDHALVGYLTTETNDLTSSVTWANVPDANITQSSVTQHQGALTITESQISDLGTYLTDAPSDGSTYGRNNGSWTVVGSTLLNIDDGAGNLVNIGNVGTSGDTGLVAQGSDPDVDIILTPKGAGQVLLPNGSSIAPGIGFASQAGSGIYSNGSSLMDVVYTGSPRLRFNASGTGLRASFLNASSQVIFTSSGVPGVGFSPPSVATVAADDKVMVWDTDDVDTPKYVTAQSIADLGGGGGGTELVNDLTPQLGGNLDGNGFSILMPDGTIGAPSYSFSSDTDTGFILSGGAVQTVVGGGARVSVDTSSIRVFGNYRASTGETFLDTSRYLQNITRATIDNIDIDGNTISSTNVDGNIILSPNGNGEVQINSNVIFDADSTYDIGSNAVRPLNVYTDNLTSSDIFTGSVNIGAETILDSNITEWNEAYSWGDHALVGYLTDAPSDGSTYGRNNGAWVVVGGGSGSSGAAGNLNSSDGAGGFSSTNLTATAGVLSTSVGNLTISPTLNAAITLQTSGLGAINIISALGMNQSSGTTFNITGEPLNLATTNNGDISLTPDGTGQVNIDNISIDGNTILTTDVDGDLTLAPNGTGQVVFPDGTAALPGIRFSGGDANDGIYFSSNIMRVTMNGGDKMLFTSTGTRITANLLTSGGSQILSQTGIPGVGFSPPAVATVATDDKVMIWDTSDSDTPKYVTAQSIADLGGGGGGGDLWSDPIDSNITVDTDSTYDIGTSTVKHSVIYADQMNAATYASIGQISISPAGASDVVMTGSGSVRPSADGASSLGESALAWGAAYVDNVSIDGNTISTTDIDGALTLAPNGTGEVISDAPLQVNEEFYADSAGATASSGVAIDWRNGNFHHHVSLLGNTTFTFTDPSGPTTLVLKFIQDGTGGRTATWPASVLWPGGTAPTLSTAGSAEDVITFYFDGTNYYGFVGLNFS